MSDMDASEACQQPMRYLDASEEAHDGDAASPPGQALPVVPLRSEGAQHQRQEVRQQEAKAASAESRVERLDDVDALGPVASPRLRREKQGGCWLV